MQDWPETLRYDPDASEDDEGDVLFDNGEVWFHGTVIGSTLHIHDLVAIDKNLQKARSGIGRRAMEQIRPLFDVISPRQVGTDLESKATDLSEHTAFLFWRAMLVEGLVDLISIGYDKDQVTRENLWDEREAWFGRYIPGEGLAPGSTLPLQAI